jgi:magnesium-transporting ATPase (P-type)
MTTVHVVGDGEVAYVKGSAEEIICRSELAPVERRRALRAGENMEKATLQVLALARKHVELAAR